jgi:hypothetical protein
MKVLKGKFTIPGRPIQIREFPLARKIAGTQLGPGALSRAQQQIETNMLILRNSNAGDVEINGVWYGRGLKTITLGISRTYENKRACKGILIVASKLPRHFLGCCDSSAMVFLTGCPEHDVGFEPKFHCGADGKPTPPFEASSQSRRATVAVSRKTR